MIKHPIYYPGIPNVAFESLEEAEEYAAELERRERERYRREAEARGPAATVGPDEPLVPANASAGRDAGDPDEQGFHF